MTAPVTESGTTTGTGRVARVIGPVVDIEFPVDSMPDMYNKLECGFERTSVNTGLTPRDDGQGSHVDLLHQARANV